MGVNPRDLEELGLESNNFIKISTDDGSVTVNWIEDNTLDEGTVFFPYGPWANQVFSSDTDSTGMPLLKSITAIIEPSEDRVKTIEEIIEMIRSGN